jgi:acetyl esterase/lipase
LIRCGQYSGETPIANTDHVPNEPLAADTIFDIPYGPDTLQRFDLFLPAGRNASHTKLIVLIHGGAWTGGDKNESKPLLLGMGERLQDYAVANMNYRTDSTDKKLIPNAMNDIAAVLKELQKEKYQLSGDVVLYGGSAGGHLAQLYAYRFDTLNQVSSVITCSSPVDLCDPEIRFSPWFKSRVSIFTDTLLDPTHDQLRSSSPLYFISPNSPPTLSVFGDLDEMIPVSQARKLDSALKRNNVSSKVIIYKGENHSDWSFQHAEDFLLRIDTFLFKK